MTEERTPIKKEIEKDLQNFKDKLQPELEFLLKKYNPSDLNISFDNTYGKGSGIPNVGIKLIFD